MAPMILFLNVKMRYYNKLYEINFHLAEKIKIII